MIARCTSPTHPRYADWGGRGITVCERWLKFENFLADMGEKPARGMSLERLDNDKGYGPGNCEWVTPVIQGRNKRNTKLTKAKVLEIERLRREIPAVTQLAEAVGLNRHLVGTVCIVLAALDDPGD